MQEKDRNNIYNKRYKKNFKRKLTKKKILKNLSIKTNNKKITIIHQSTLKVKVDFSKKKKNYFVYWQT